MIKIRFILLYFVLLLGIVSAQVVSSDPSFSGSNRGTASFVNYGSSFSSYYGSNAQTYWPILNERDQCVSQDITLQVTPAGCQPAVVRSDLLAEQNVPVFCQLDLLQLNPAIDIKQIRNIRFNGRYPDYVAGVGFHPANAALRTTNQLLGTPLQSNIGYIVVVLKRNPDENTMPEFFNFTLSASVDYYSGNAIGIGATEMLLKESSDSEWKIDKNKQTIFGGRMSVRVKEIDNNDSISVEIYSGDIKYSEITLRKNSPQPSPVYLPGSYCQTALQFSYGDFVSPPKIARLQVDRDLIDVYQGSRFLNNKCAVRGIVGDTVELSCGRENPVLTNKPQILNIGDKVYKVKDKFEVDTSVTYEVSGNVTENGVLKYEIFDVADAKMVKTKEEFSLLRPVSSAVLYEATYDKASEEYIRDALLNYELVSDSYGNEKKDLGDLYGDVALSEAIRLAVDYTKKNTALRLINKYISNYPDGKNINEFLAVLNQLYSRDSSNSSTSIQMDDGHHTIRLVEVTGSGKVSRAKISWGQDIQDVEQGKNAKFSFGTISLTSVINSESVQLKAVCNDKKNGFDGRISTTGSADACGQTIRVSQIDFQNYVKLRISPVTRSGSISNFTVGIGIEKRLIELTPDKAKKKIENLNKSIQKWESISEKLGEVVTGLKTACFATAGVLTVKNFFTGLSGEALARRGVMSGDDGWTRFCQNEVNLGKTYAPTLTACYNHYSSDIAKDVASRKNAITQSNELTKRIETENPQGEGAFNERKAKEELIQEINTACTGVNLGNKSLAQGPSYTNVNEIIKSTNVDSYTYQQLRDIYFNCKVAKDTSGSPRGIARAQAELDTIGGNVGERLNYDERVKTHQDVNIYSIDNKNRGRYSGETIETLKLKGYTFGSFSIPDKSPAQVVAGKGGTYLVVFDKTNEGYRRKEIYSLSNKNVDSKIQDSTSSSTAANALPDDLESLPTLFDLTNSASYNNQFATGEATVRYFDTEPYKGRPAVVPFDLNKGFYAATTQALPIFGGTKSFEENGRPSTFYVCNIMGDKRVGFYQTNFGDDQCVRFDYYTGQSFSNFPGLTEQKTKNIVSQAVEALREAGSQYGNKQVRVRGNLLNVGNAAALLPGSQCQDFMSLEDCKILFNVCDPVICPASRCNFGGEYYVSDVIQSGIVGSALLCLPNYREGIIAPVCLTGIKAGIDGYLSILKSHQACLEEAVETGKYVGICDQVSSVYLCEFFWRQAAPLAKTILPKLVESVYSGGQTQVRGGGEYMTVASSWQNAQDSVNYFTQSYAVNSFDAFKVRSIEEAGTEICRAFISAKVPNSFETLIEPDSPPQFHAWYSAIDYTDATIPATSQYKVFYHVFAGEERGVSYSVYLKDPPSGGQYASAPILAVANGFIARGQYATESKDFTAPKGYQQLCVRINDKEECGFKQVSSSFAVDFVTNKIVNDELSRTDIKTEQECISGAVSPAALLNPNPGAAVDEALNPAIYNRGVVRVCATDNPGITTDPARFVKVGVCGVDRLGCWLDKNSVKNTIDASNTGLRDKTLSEIEQIQRQNFNQGNRYTVSTDLQNEVKGIDIDTKDKSKLKGYLDKLNLLNPFWNYDIAEVTLMKARIFDRLFRTSVVEFKVTGPSSGSTTPSTSTPASQTPPASAGSSTKGIKILKLEKTYSSTEKEPNYFNLNGVRTTIYTQGSRIFSKETGLFGDWSVRDINIGIVYRNNKIKIINNYHWKWNNILGIQNSNEKIEGQLVTGEISIGVSASTNSNSNIDSSCILVQDCIDKFGEGNYDCVNGYCVSIENSINPIIGMTLSNLFQSSLIDTDYNNRAESFPEILGDNPLGNRKPLHNLIYSNVPSVGGSSGDLVVKTWIYAPSEIGKKNLFNEFRFLDYMILFYDEDDIIKAVIERKLVGLTDDSESNSRFSEIRIPSNKFSSSGLVSGENYKVKILLWSETNYFDEVDIKFGNNYFKPVF